MHHQARKTYRQPTVMPRLWNVCPPTDSTTVESERAENLPLNSGSPWRWFGPYLGTFDSVQRHFPLSQLGGRGRVLLISTQQRLLPPPPVHRNQPPKTVSYKYQQRWHWETMVWSKEACLHFYVPPAPSGLSLPFISIELPSPTLGLFWTPKWKL